LKSIQFSIENPVNRPIPLIEKIIKEFNLPKINFVVSDLADKAPDFLSQLGLPNFQCCIKSMPNKKHITRRLSWTISQQMSKSSFKCLMSSIRTSIDLETIIKEKSPSQYLDDLEGDLPFNRKTTKNMLSGLLSLKWEIINFAEKTMKKIN